MNTHGFTLRSERLRGQLAIFRAILSSLYQGDSDARREKGMYSSHEPLLGRANARFS